MILVIGATGTVGRRVVAQLRTAGAAVRAVSRHPSSATPGEVEVAADLADPGSLTPHLRDVRGVFLVWPFPSAESTARLAPQVIEVLATSLRRIVYLSAAAAADDPGSFWALVERHVRRAGVPWTFLRPTGFARNTLLWAPQIRSGDVVRWPTGGPPAP